MLSAKEHERIARETIAANPDLVTAKRFYALVIAAQKANPGKDLSQFYLAKLMGEIVRGEI